MSEWGAGDITAIILAVLGIVTLVWKTISNWLSTKFKTPADVIEEKKVDDAANNVALARLEGLLKSSDERHKQQMEELKTQAATKEREWNTKFEDMERKLEEVRNFNNDLVRFSYTCIDIIRRANMMHLLPKVGPKGIYYERSGEDGS